MQTTNKNVPQNVPIYGYGAADAPLWSVFVPNNAPSRDGIKESARVFFPGAVALGELATKAVADYARRYSYQGRHRTQPEPVGVVGYAPSGTLLDGVMADAAQLPTVELPVVSAPGYVPWNSPTVPLHILPHPVAQPGELEPVSK